MRIVLKNSRSGLYLENLGKWSSSAEKAQSFQNALRAVHFSAFHQIDAEVVPILEDSDPVSGKASKPRARNSYLDADWENVSEKLPSRRAFTEI